MIVGRWMSACDWPQNPSCAALLPCSRVHARRLSRLHPAIQLPDEPHGVCGCAAQHTALLLHWKACTAQGASALLLCLTDCGKKPLTPTFSVRTCSGALIEPIIRVLVRAAGNYRFLEFARIGFPLQIWLIGVVIIIFALEDSIGIAIAIFFVLAAIVIGGAFLQGTTANSAPITPNQLATSDLRQRRCKS